MFEMITTEIQDGPDRRYVITTERVDKNYYFTEVVEHERESFDPDEFKYGELISDERWYSEISAINGHNATVNRYITLVAVKD